MSIEHQKTFLTNASIADARHDFGGKVPNFLDWLRNNIVSFKNGLPTITTASIDTWDEKTTLQNVVQGDKIRLGTHVLNSSETNYNFSFDSHSITTINNIVYSIECIQIHKSIGVDAEDGGPVWDRLFPTRQQFVTKLGIENNSVFVIDATSISFNDIMQNIGPHEGGSVLNGEVPTRYFYIYASELENDPAGKTSPDDSIFKKGPYNGCTLTSLVPATIGDPLKTYNYNWEDTQTSPYNTFYTKYTFRLSELQPIMKGKTLKYTTNLNITNPEKDTLNLAPIINSKESNSIASLKSLLSSIMSSFRSSNKDSTYHINAHFQQKRGGDWLQVLLCLLIKHMDLVDYNVDIHTIIDNNIFTDIYFITHDQIAAAFALYLGVNVIFTHSASKTVHTFKCSTPAELEARNRDKITKIITEKININRLILKCDELRRLYNRQIFSIPTDTDMAIHANCDNLYRLLQNPPTDIFYSENIDIYTQLIFTDAYLSCYLKTIIPDISSFNHILSGYVDASIDALQNKYDEVIRNNTYDANKIELINLYDDIKKKQNEILNFRNIFEPFFIFSGSESESEPSVNPLFAKEMLIRALKKQPSYKSIVKWTWDISLGSRAINDLRILVGFTNYRNDINVFLYNITNLDHNLKHHITDVYTHLYRYIPTLTNIVVSPKNNKYPVKKQKFVDIVQSFCIEVLVNIGTVIPAEGRSLIDEYITTYVKKSLFYDEINKRGPVECDGSYFTKYDESINGSKLLSEAALISENTDIIEDEEDATPVYIDSSLVVPFDDVITHVKYEPQEIECITKIFNEDATLHMEDITYLIENIDKLEHTPNSLLDVSSVASSVEEIPLDININQNPKNVINILLSVQLSYNAIQDFMSFLIVVNTEYNSEQQLIETLKNLSGQTEIIFQREISQIVNEVDRLQKRNEIDIRRHIMLSRLPAGITRQISLLPPIPMSHHGRFASALGGGGKTRVDIDILSDNFFCFYPLLPIYMITDSLLYIIENNNIIESLDYELWLQYFNFLQGLYQGLTKYLNKESSGSDKIKAYIIGMALKELLFTSNVNENNEDCATALKMPYRNYYPISSMSSTLSNIISGRIIQTEDEKKLGSILLKSSVFIEYLEQIDMNKKWESPINYIKTKDLYDQAKHFLLDVGHRIIEGRTRNIRVDEVEGELTTLPSNYFDNAPPIEHEIVNTQTQKNVEPYIENDGILSKDFDKIIPQPDYSEINTSFNKGGKTKKNRRIYRRKYTRNSNRRSKNRRNKLGKSRNSRNSRNKKTRRDKK
jgi:hypothetical protein